MSESQWDKNILCKQLRISQSSFSIQIASQTKAKTEFFTVVKEDGVSKTQVWNENVLLHDLENQSFLSCT